jgi:hypothetical protein
MLDLMNIKLSAQKLTLAPDYRVSDKLAHAIKKQGLCLVHKPDNSPIKNLEAKNEIR